MFRKNYISLFLFIAIFAVGSISAFAQKDAGGKIELKDAKGVKTPVVGATIYCYRIDVKESCGTKVSDEKGKFKFEGLPKEAIVVFAASGKGISPLVTPDILFTDGNVLTATEGDGSVPSEETVRLSAIQYAKEKGKLTESQKASLAEYEKKIADREAAANKTKENNKLREQYLNEGNKAFNSKNYDLAIEKFDAGYKIDPEFLGSAPVFLNNKAQSLKIRSIDKYNAAVRAKDRDAISKARLAVVNDFKEALNATTKIYEMTSDPKLAKDSNPQRIKEDKKKAKELTKEIFNIMGQINVNLASSISTEEDAEKAVSMYKISLDILPDDPNVLAGLAMALYSSGDFKGNNEEKKQSLETWNKFKKIAPKDHKQQATADGMIEFLKDEVK